MSLAKLDHKLPMTEGQLIDLTKCNSAYQTKIKDLESNSEMIVNVNLKCSNPHNVVDPSGKSISFKKLVFFVINNFIILAKFCIIQNSMVINGREEFMINPVKIECPSGQCVDASSVCCNILSF
jgi:hypothetical protein